MTRQSKALIKIIIMTHKRGDLIDIQGIARIMGRDWLEAVSVDVDRLTADGWLECYFDGNTRLVALKHPISVTRKRLQGLSGSA